jgi:CubicO group peptidase (beta-lactamase class C family)
MVPRAIPLLLAAMFTLAAQGPSDPKELEAFLDGFMSGALNADGVAGATVSVVKDGKLMLAKGYGFADLKRRRLVDAGHTLFRIASISKTFLWTAVMQLQEQGKLDLNADINRYVKGFRVPDQFGRPITMANLMTHTPGLEDRVISLFATKPSDMIPLPQVLSRDFPSRVRPPGEVIAYSNFGTVLAALAVQEISGTPYEEYLEKNIFTPLAMTRTTIRQPVPAPLAEDLSVGYVTGDADNYKAGDFEYLPGFPAGAISTPAADMANYMIAQLQGGRFGDKRIGGTFRSGAKGLPEFRYHPRTSWLHAGFFEETIEGVRVVGHGGDLTHFHSTLFMMPESGVGVFASFNTQSGGKARANLRRAFVKRYYAPAAEPAPEPPADFRQRAAKYTGYYWTTRREYTTALAAAVLFENLGAAAKVSVNDDGTLRAFGKRWVEVEPLVFRSISGRDTLVFRQDAQGGITMALPSMFGFEKVSWLKSPPVQTGFLGACGVLFLSAFLVWPVAGVINLRHGLAAERGYRTRAMACWTMGFAALAGTLFFAGFAWKAETMVNGVSTFVRLLLAVPLITSLLTCAGIWFTCQAWKKRLWSTSGRIHYTAVAAAAVLYHVYLYCWNLIGYHV